ncbi:MAG: S8/S53 family peptidase, partial [Actinomycetota bacterium]|nr:S8/S53 family peptidase [Actinomycetota bacterium]
VLVVAVHSFTEGLRWASRQPWIDAITNSWTTLDAEPITEGAAEASRDAVASGKVVCFASGNLSAPLWFAGEQGPSWNLHVGAASSTTRGEHYYTGWPNDVLGIANVPAADNESIDGEVAFGGTSAATPHVCGLIAKTLSQVRASMSDVVQGPHKEALAVGRSKGAYFDGGRLTNYELIDAVQATAVPAQPAPPNANDPYAVPALPLVPWVRGGYGIVDRDSVRDAYGVILGTKRRPDRPNEDMWVDTLDRLRNLIWGDPP